MFFGCRVSTTYVKGHNVELKGLRRTCGASWLWCCRFVYSGHLHFSRFVLISPLSLSVSLSLSLSFSHELLILQTDCLAESQPKTHLRYKLLGIGNHSSHESQGRQSIPDKEVESWNSALAPTEAKAVLPEFWHPLFVLEWFRLRLLSRAPHQVFAVVSELPPQLFSRVLSTYIQGIPVQTMIVLPMRESTTCIQVLRTLGSWPLLAAADRN